MINSINLKKQTHLFILFVVFCFFSINAFTQYLVTNTADLDQAEQLLLSYSFELGYNSQPPLYSYIVMFVFKVFGVSLVSLAIIKVVLLTTTSAGFILIGRHFNFSTLQIIISLLGLMMIPQYIWESQRDLTHSVLCTASACLTLYMVLKLKEYPSITNYVLLGILVSIGFLSKYTFVILVGAIVIASVINKTYRHIVLTPKILVAFAVFVVLVSPHLYWVIDNFSASTSSLNKLDSTSVASANSYLTGLLTALLSAFAFVSPLWLIGLPILLTSKFRLQNPKQINQVKFLGHIALCALGLIFAIVIVFKAQNIKDRWYQPLLFFTPLLISFLVPTAKKWAVTLFISISTILLLFVLLWLPLRTYYADKISKYSRPNMPYTESLSAIIKPQKTIDFILAENKLLGGNARLIANNIPIRIPEYTSNPITIKGKGIVLCESEFCDSEELTNWLKTCSDIASHIRPSAIQKSVMPYRYVENKKLTIYWQTITLDACKL